MANWSIIETKDEGGFGKVYKVQDSDSKKYGALKELKNLSSQNLIRFRREIETLQKFNHNHIIKIYEYNIKGSEKVGPFYIMEFMAGGSLRDKLDTTFSSGNVCNAKWTLGTIILPVVDAINYAHSNGIYHRDLKPANLLFSTPTQDCIIVADWGIGKDINRNSIALTIGGIGTPGYCSPEQWFANSVVDGRTDVYSLGVIFYEMLTGKIPQIYNNSGQIFQVQLPSSLNKTVPQKLNEVILKMINYSAKSRYQTMADVKSELAQIYHGM